MREITHACPFCGDTNDCVDAASGEDMTPGDGDCVLCWSCGSWCTWEGSGMRQPTDAEADAIQASADCTIAKKLWQGIRDGTLMQESHGRN
jgi:hypothetical protein